MTDDVTDDMHTTTRAPLLRRLTPLSTAVALLAAPASASAQLFGGQVVDVRTSEPIEGIALRLLRCSAVGAPPIVVDSTRTFDRGVFQIAAPGPGTYRLEFGPRAAPVARGPVDTVAADAFLQRRYDVALPDPATAGPYLEFQVDEKVAPLGGVAAPRYPQALRDRGVEGDVQVQFVVDAEGRVERASFRIIEATHADFAEAVRATVAAMRYRPARRGGVAVRQIVQQPFQFRIGRP